MIAISFLSMAGSLFVATTIIYSKKLQAHPQRLIAYTCLCEAISSFNGVVWTVDTQRVIKYIDMNQVFSWCFFFEKGSEVYERSLGILHFSNDFFFQYFSLLTLFLNMCLCIDLILTLKNPFEPAKRRMKFYLSASALLCVPLAFLTRQSISSGNFSNSNPSPDNNYLSTDIEASHLILAMCLSVYMLIALYSCVYASRRLARPSINKKIRHFFLRKHYYYVAIFTIVWGFYLANAYFQLFYPDFNQYQGYRHVVIYMSKVASVSTGVLLTIIRLCEPYFMYQVSKRFYAFFGVEIKDDAEYSSDLYKNTLNSYLTRSLNLELVNIILSSIVMFT